MKLNIVKAEFLPSLSLKIQLAICLSVLLEPFVMITQKKSICGLSRKLSTFRVNYPIFVTTLKKSVFGHNSKTINISFKITIFCDYFEKKSFFAHLLAIIFLATLHSGL